MHSLRNQVTIIGDLRQEAEITKFESGAMVARFGIEPASLRTTAGSSQPQLTKTEKATRPYQLFAWGGVAAFIHQYCSRGCRLAVTGRLVNRTYVRKDGTPCKVTEVEVRQVVKL